MRILQVINSLFTAGAEKLVVDTSRKFLEKGHQVDLLLLNRVGSGLEKEMLDNKNIGVYFTSDSTNIYSPIHILWISRHLKKHSYDIVHVHLFPAFYWVALAFKYDSIGKLVHTEHNTTNRRMGNWIYRVLDRFIYEKYDFHVAISNAVRTNLDAHLSLKTAKIVNIYNGIDLVAISSAIGYDRKEFDLATGEKMILQVSAFRPQKNQATLIKAIAKLDSNVNLFFAGDGELKNECVELAKSLGLENQVHFLGVRDDVPRLLKTADIVVLSSHYEGLSLASVEGMASGKPFIASDVPGLSEVVEGAGLLFPDNDFKKLAELIDELLNDELHYRKVVANCLNRSRKFDMNTMIDEHIELYLSN